MTRSYPSKLQFAILVLLNLLLTACTALFGAGIAPTLDPKAINIIVAETAAEAATQTAVHLPPTSTPTQTPSPTPTTTSTPVPWLTVRVSLPLVISGQNNQIYSGLRISNLNGSCIEIQNSENIEIVQSEIGPCLRSGIMVRASSHIAIKDNYIHDTGEAMKAYGWGSDVDAYDVTDMLVARNRLEWGSSGVYASKSTEIVVSHNQISNVKGPFPRGQFVQFTQAYGRGNRVVCNIGEQLSLDAFSEDKINMWKSSGLPEDPIIIAYNKLRGSGRSPSAASINIGDGGGAYIHAYQNIAVNAGNVGLIIPGGHDLSFTDNIVFGAAADWKTDYSIPGYVWDYYKSGACYSNTYGHNKFLWFNNLGEQTSFLDMGDCGPIGEVDTNEWLAPIDASIWDMEFPECNMNPLNELIVN